MSASLEPRVGRAWDGLRAAEIAALAGVSHVVLFDEVGSTQDVAHALAEEEGARSGTLVLADRQTAGRGRLRRAWASEAGKGVWASFIAPPDPEPPALDVLSIRIGLELARRLDAVAGEPVGLKWPNDLVLREGKLGGILVETWLGAESFMVIGVGINVQRPRDVAGAAALPAGTKRIDVLVSVARSVQAVFDATGHLSETEMKEYASRDRLVGRRLASPWPGIARGIENNGCLIIDTPQGPEYRRSGTVQLAEDA